MNNQEFDLQLPVSELPTSERSRSTSLSSSKLSTPNSQSLLAVTNVEKGLDLVEMLAVLQRRLPIIVCATLLSIGLSYWWARSRPRSYEASFELLVQNNTAESRLANSVPQSSGYDNSESLRQDNTLLTLLLSPKILRPVLNSLQAEYPDLTYQDLSKSLVLENPSKTNILRVTYNARNPEQVKKVLRLVARAYLNYSLTSRRTDTNQGLRFVEGQLPILEQQVNQLQLQLQRFRQTYNLSDPNTQSEKLATQISTIYQQQFENRIALQEAQSSYTDLQQQFHRTDAYRLAAAALLKNPNYQKIRNQLLDIDNQIARQSIIYSSNHPALVDLREQRQKLLPLLVQEANQVIQEMDSGIRDLQARKQALSQTYTTLSADMKQLSLRTREYNDLQRELRIATDNLTQFLGKREALRIEAAQQEIPWELTTPPGNPSPVLIGTSRVVFLGGLLGLLLGSGIAFLIDKFKNVFYTPKDVKGETTLPLLGVLPLASEVPKLMAARFKDTSEVYRSTPFIEASRSLYANIRLLNVDKPIRSLVITSVHPNDGKTTVAINLAKIASSIGLRVLLVDTDLRNPQVHEFLGLENQHGLTELMTGQLRSTQVFQRLSADKQLFVLSTGQIPPDPLMILTSKKMKHLMARLESTFDLVIYDTPPALELADAAVLSSQTDGVALVVKLGNTERSAFNNTLESLSRASINIHGVIVNGWKAQGQKYDFSTPKQSAARTLVQA